MSHKRFTYDDRSGAFAKACDIALEVLQNHSPAEKDALISFVSRSKNMALNPEPQFRKIASLKYLESDFFSYWNESAGEHIDMFWGRMSQEQLGYERRDLLQDILNRDKIRGSIEYHHVVDTMLIARQTEKINDNQLLRLNQMISEFEKRGQ